MRDTVFDYCLYVGGICIVLTAINILIDYFRVIS
jgi:hypothetical protein